MPPPPTAQPPATPSEGWEPPSEQAPVTVIRIETDAGSTVAAASFVGDECFGVTKVERARQRGESRRVRRKAKAPPVEKAPRDPRAAAFLSCCAQIHASISTCDDSAGSSRRTWR